MGAPIAETPHAKATILLIIDMDRLLLVNALQCKPV
jgi:hypothetical protein